MIIPIIVLLIVFILIAVRQIGKIRLEIWQIMLFGALIVIILRQISPINALSSINLDVILFLLGMFIVGVGLEESGYLSHLSYKLFKKAKTLNHLILFILFGAGILSAFLMNDTLAIIGTPVVLLLSKKHKLHPQILMITLCFAITIGSVISPIGNPQNLLVAINGKINNPFLIFLKYLLIPTIINMFICFFVLKFFYKDHFHKKYLNHSQEPIKDHNLSVLSKISLSLIIVLIFIKIIITSFNPAFDFKLTYIALIAGIPILFSKRRIEIIKKVDWSTLIFFISMFILMQSVWNSGFFQQIINHLGLNISSIVLILIISIVLSQFISNVPLVALYLPILINSGAGTKEMIALAVGSTIAGNLFILGAASNIIIIQNSEKKAGETITFWDFARVGIPLTIINILVYWFFLAIL
ncbi:Citrate transporter [uncultured archaeon]|nr:Citrate transporter [uncultured archaeon]